ncbi:MAG: sigma-70 family RNA polymerase sigma factor [Planctomycetes bacterium]|nr:sigma-70 family RNA polymerase sigma factor [Planctomycetota bacterium]
MGLQDDVKAARRGDVGAMESVFARNMNPLVAFIRARAGRDLMARESAVDLAQSVCREVIQDLDAFEYRGDEEFRAWLFQQATRKILDRARYHNREKRAVDREVAIPDEESAEALLACYAELCTPSRYASARDDLARFEAAVQKLPDAQRDAVTMSRLMHLPYPVIAEQLGVTESAVRGLVARGLATLVEAIQ